MFNTMNGFLLNIDSESVGSICIDSTTYKAISDVFDMENRVCNISSVLSGKRTVVGKLHSKVEWKLVMKLNKVENYIIGIAKCYGIQVYKSLNNCNVDTNDFAWFYIDLLNDLAQNVRAKLLLQS